MTINSLTIHKTVNLAFRDVIRLTFTAIRGDDYVLFTEDEWLDFCKEYQYPEDGREGANCVDLAWDFKNTAMLKRGITGVGYVNDYSGIPGHAYNMAVVKDANDELKVMWFDPTTKMSPPMLRHQMYDAKRGFILF